MHRLLLHVLVFAMCSPAARGAVKLNIESPANGQRFAGGRVIVAVKVDPSVGRLKAVVTVRAVESGSSATPATSAEARRVFALGPVELPRGSAYWSPEVRLAKGENTITITDADDDKTSAAVTVTADDNELSSDPRDDFRGTFYAGASIDSFASGETRQYIGYTAADSGQKTGYAAGVDFQYRLFKRDTDSRWPMQLWLFGETVHGQRSTEVDCKQSAGNGSSEVPVCAGFNPETAAVAFLAILRNSSSLEAHAGARLEFLKLNKSSNYSANLYLKSQAGFITVQNNGGDVADEHLKVGLGTIMTNGTFAGSYLDTGWGRSDLYALHRGRRFKVDGYVQFEAKITGNVSFYPFFQMVVDSDFGRGADDVRTYYGINMDIQGLACLFRASGCANKTAPPPTENKPKQTPGGSNQ